MQFKEATVSRLLYTKPNNYNWIPEMYSNTNYKFIDDSKPQCILSKSDNQTVLILYIYGQRNLLTPRLECYAKESVLADPSVLYTHHLK